MKDCIKEAERQLGNKQYYKVFYSDLTETHKNLVDQAIYWFKRNTTLNEKLAENVKWKIQEPEILYKAKNP